MIHVWVVPELGVSCSAASQMRTSKHLPCSIHRHACPSLLLPCLTPCTPITSSTPEDAEAKTKSGTIESWQAAGALTTSRGSHLNDNWRHARWWAGRGPPRSSPKAAPLLRAEGTRGFAWVAYSARMFCPILYSRSKSEGAKGCHLKGSEPWLQRGHRREHDANPVRVLVYTTGD